MWNAFQILPSLNSGAHACPRIQQAYPVFSVDVIDDLVMLMTRLRILFCLVL